MFGRLFYQEKGLFLQSLHPAAGLVYLLVLLLLSLLYENPLYLLALFFLLVLLINEVDGLEAWEGMLKAGIFLMLVVMVVNPLVIRAGETVIWHGPTLPFLGKLTVSMEALAYGAAASLRLLVIISIFSLYNLMISPDRVFDLFAKAMGKSILMIALSTRLFPVMVRDLQRIKEVQQLRGVDFETGSLWTRVKKYSLIYNVLLLSSLEGALGVAESMQARAYGSGRRSVYRRDLVRPRDVLCLAGSLLALVAAAWGLRYGYGKYTFYPEADYLIKDGATLPVLLAVMFYLSVPLIISRGWKHCRFLRSNVGSHFS